MLGPVGDTGGHMLPRLTPGSYGQRGQVVVGTPITGELCWVPFHQDGLHEGETLRPHEDVCDRYFTGGSLRHSSFVLLFRIQVSRSISLISTNSSLRIFSNNSCGSQDAGEYVEE